MRSKKKAVEDMIQNQCAEEIKRTWLSTGGLIPTYMAAMMLNVSIPRISQIWKERNFKKYSFEDGKRDLISFADVIKIYEEKEKSFYNFYTQTDEENGIIIEVKAFKSKNEDNKNTKINVIENLKDMLYFLEKNNPQGETP